MVQGSSRLTFATYQGLQPRARKGWYPALRFPLREQVVSILENADLEIVYQPAIWLDQPRIAFFEALARFPSHSGETPALWFETAATMGLGPQFELLALRCACRGLETLPQGVAVSINLSPSTILSSIFSKQIASAPLERIILEITENQPVSSYSALIGALKPFRDLGMRVTIDDAGAGHASCHVLEIQPDIIKLDASICRDIHQDRMRQSLAMALIDFARKTGSDLVAEGVESVDELASLRALGMSIVQGHVVSRPLSLDRAANSTAIESPACSRMRRAAACVA